MKKILYSVLGLSPQILTETIYALAKESPPFIPDEIHVLTTSRGAKLCKLALFQENGGWFHKLCNDLGLKDIDFSEKHIHNIINTEGEVLDDIRSKEDNNAVANQIMEHIREFTEGDSTLHVSIAGGRKTMGFYAGYALSMFGRPQDQLSHVLVDPSFEAHPNFFYPTPYPSVIRSRDGNELLDRKDAVVDLAYMPFIHMKASIPKTFLNEKTTFEEMVDFLQKRVFDKKILVSASDNCIYVEDKKVKLTAANFVFYYWLAKKVTSGNPSFELPFETEPNTHYADEYRQTADKIIDEMKDMDRTLDNLENGMHKDFIRDRKSQIKKAFIKVLGVNAENYLIHYLQDQQQGLKLKPNQIEFV